MKPFLKVLLLLICNLSFAQTNLLDTSTWIEGTGSVAGFTRSGTDAENIREMGIGPHGTEVLLWKTIPEATGNTGAGGWTTGLINIDPTKTYRTTVWIKKTNSTDGTTYVRLWPKDSSGNSATNNLSGTANANPFFWSGDLPALDKWYLLVGYVHHKDYTLTTSIGGVYDGVTGSKTESTTDFKFQSTASQILQMVWLSADTNAADSQYYYGPTLYEVNGQEPTIQELIDGENPQSTELNWTLNNQDVYYNTGNVGIGTDTPDEKLAVNGTIHSKEVRVDLNNWPDYVFTKAYHLPTLQEVEHHIKTKGHLPNIPSADDVEANGVLLGDINTKLLEKIEELTLYIIAQEKQIKELEKRVLKK